MTISMLNMSFFLLSFFKIEKKSCVTKKSIRKSEKLDCFKRAAAFFAWGLLPLVDQIRFHFKCNFKKRIMSGEILLCSSVFFLCSFDSDLVSFLLFFIPSFLMKHDFFTMLKQRMYPVPKIRKYEKRIQEKFQILQHLVVT